VIRNGSISCSHQKEKSRRKQKSSHRSDRLVCPKNDWEFFVVDGDAIVSKGSIRFFIALDVRLIQGVIEKIEDLSNNNPLFLLNGKQRPRRS
jgi:hypothetical protein